jgi:hypothetical protein
MMKKGMIAAGAALVLVLMTGCGSDQTSNGGQNVNAGVSQEQPANGQTNRQPVDLLGKVKSINGQTITVYKSVPGGPGGQGRQGGQGGQGNGGQQPPSDNQQPQGGGQQPADGNGGRQGRMNMEFTEETVDVQVTESTKIVKREFVDNQMNETEITALDLKADDIVSIDLKDDTQEAVTISLGNGGMGGARGQGGVRGQNQGQTPAQTPAQ